MQVVLIVLLLLSTVWANVNTPGLQDSVVESQSLITNRDSLATFAVTIHVILQFHEHPDPQGRVKQDLQALTSCQNNVVKTALKIAAAGAPTVVVEGLYAQGTLSKPEPVIIDAAPQQSQVKAKWLLAQRRDLSVYGFELKPLNEFNVNTIKYLGQSVAAIGRDPDQPDVELTVPERKLLQKELARLNLWYAGIIPQRSFLALQTALAVALTRGAKEIQLIIGKQHWNDLVYAVTRHEDVRIRLLRYSCD